MGQVNTNGDQDADKVLLASFYLLGMGVVSSWVALLQTMDYLNIIFKEFSPSRVLTAGYAAFDLLALSVLFFFGKQLWAGKRSRMVVGYTLCTAVTALIPILDVLLLDNKSSMLAPQTAHKLYFAAWATYSIVVGAASAIVGSVSYGEAAVFGPEYCHAFVCGRAASGLTCITLRCLTKAILPDTLEGLRHSTVLFFSVATLIVLACAVVSACVLPSRSSQGARRRAAALNTAHRKKPTHPVASAAAAADAGSLHEPLLAGHTGEEPGCCFDGVEAHLSSSTELNSQSAEGGRVAANAAANTAPATAAVAPQAYDRQGQQMYHAAGDGEESGAHLYVQLDSSTPIEADGRNSNSSSNSPGVEQQLLQSLPRHLSCKVVSPYASVDDLTVECEDEEAASRPLLLPAYYEPTSATAAAAAAAAAEFGPFHFEHSAALGSNARSETLDYGSARCCTTPPLLPLSYHGPTPPGSYCGQSPYSVVVSGSAFGAQQQYKLRLVVEGASFTASCWAAVKYTRSYLVAMFIAFYVPMFMFPAVMSPAAATWPAVGSWYTIILVFAFQSGAVVGSALPIWRNLRHPHTVTSALAWGMFALLPLTLAALGYHAGPAAFITITFASMVYGYHVASLVFCFACDGLAAADVELVQGLLVMTLTAARLVGLLMSWLWG